MVIMDPLRGKYLFMSSQALLMGVGMFTGYKMYTPKCPPTPIRNNILENSVIYKQCFGSNSAPLEDEEQLRRLKDAIMNSMNSTEIPSDNFSDVAENYYIPIVLWLENKVRTRSDKDGPALCVGISIPQGGGKTTLTSCFEKALNEACNLNTAGISIDDFHLTHEEQVALGSKFPDNVYY